MKTYIMSPEQYYSLCQVRGFSDYNGISYQEHIVRIFNNRLTKDKKQKILSITDDQESLKILEQYNIKFTHVYEQIELKK
jgi:hypothetical protein